MYRLECETGSLVDQPLTQHSRDGVVQTFQNNPFSIFSNNTLNSSLFHINYAQFLDKNTNKVDIPYCIHLVQPLVQPG